MWQEQVAYALELAALSMALSAADRSEIAASAGTALAGKQTAAAASAESTGRGLPRHRRRALRRPIAVIKRPSAMLVASYLAHTVCCASVLVGEQTTVWSQHGPLAYKESSTQCLCLQANLDCDCASRRRMMGSSTASACRQAAAAWT